MGQFVPFLGRVSSFRTSNKSAGWGVGGAVLSQSGQVRKAALGDKGVELLHLGSVEPKLVCPAEWIFRQSVGLGGPRISTNGP